MDFLARLNAAMSYMGGFPGFNNEQSYSFNSSQNYFFPIHSQTGSNVPRGLSKIMDLPHGDVVTEVVISRDKSRVYTGGKGTVKIWDVRENDAPRPAVSTLDCLGNNFVRSCKLLNDGCTLIVSGEDEKIVLLDLNTETIKHVFDSGSLSCYSLVISQDERLVFGATADGHIQIYDIVSHETVGKLPGHFGGTSCLDLSRNGQTLWSGGLDNSLRSWDLRQRTQISKRDVYSQIFTLACSPTDNELVAVGTEDSNICVISTVHDMMYRRHKHNSCVLSLKFSHSGNYFISTSKDNSLIAWKTTTGETLFQNAESEPLICCDISYDDALIVTGSATNNATLHKVNYN